MKNKIYENFTSLAKLLKQNPQKIQSITAIVANTDDKAVFTDLPKTTIVESEKIFCLYDGIPVVLSTECPKNEIYVLYKGTQALDEEPVTIPWRTIWKWNNDALRKFNPAN